MAKETVPAFDWTRSQKKCIFSHKFVATKKRRGKKKLLLDFRLHVKEPFATMHTQSNEGNDDSHGNKHIHHEKHDSNHMDINTQMCLFAVAVAVSLFNLSLPSSVQIVLAIIRPDLSVAFCFCSNIQSTLRGKNRASKISSPIVMIAAADAAN